MADTSQFNDTAKEANNESESGPDTTTDEEQPPEKKEQSPVLENGTENDTFELAEEKTFELMEDKPFGLTEDLDSDNVFENAPLPPFEELACSMFVHNRILATKRIMDAFQKAGTNKEELQSVVALMCKLSEDEEAMVRSELVLQIPSIAIFCYHHSTDLKMVIRQQLVPYVVKLMNDSQLAVCKLGQSALIILLENQLIDDSQLSEWICPYVAQLAVCDSNLEELRIEDVALMSKMAPLVGKDIAVKFFLEPFLALCLDPGFLIRKVCATNIGTFCSTVGTEVTESSLMPSFLNLCSDDKWVVRKACADVFMEISKNVSLKTRKLILPHLFIKLLNDKSPFVRSAAVQSLGGFISTFAGTSESTCSEEAQNDEHCSLYNNCQTDVEVAKTPVDLQKTYRRLLLPNDCNSEGIDKILTLKTELTTPPTLDVAKDGHLYLHTDNENHFNNFQFWRNPLPEIESDIDVDRSKSINIDVTEKTRVNDFSHTCASDIKVCFATDQATSNNRLHEDGSLSKIPVQAACINTFNSSSKNLKQDLMCELPTFYRKSFNEKCISSGNDFICNLSNTDEKPKVMTSSDQNIVPEELLFKYALFVNGTEYVNGIEFEGDSPANKHHIEERIGYCAYSFPAVAFTLGKKYWPYLKNICDNLARNMKWTIRRTLASSLHELANILGHDITVTDLLPIFIDLMKDVDEVKLRLVEHLADFLKYLNQEERNRLLPLLNDFSVVDNEKNWRFRCTIAEQLGPTMHLFSADHVNKHFVPIAFTLIKDKISSVRLKTVHLMASIIKKLYCEGQSDHAIALIDKLDLTIAKSRKWLWRQTFVFFCEELVWQHSLTKKVYVEEILFKLLPLSEDSVPNVRLAVARSLSRTLSLYDILCDLESAKHEYLLQVVCSLQTDLDVDVKYYATLCYLGYDFPKKEVLPV